MLKLKLVKGIDIVSGIHRTFGILNTGFILSRKITANKTSEIQGQSIFQLAIFISLMYEKSQDVYYRLRMLLLHKNFALL